MLPSRNVQQVYFMLTEYSPPVQNLKMATGGKKPKYGGDKKVDEWLLNQVVKHVNHDEIGSFARDLEVPESVYSSITKEKDKTFKVRVCVQQYN